MENMGILFGLLIKAAYFGLILGLSVSLLFLIIKKKPLKFIIPIALVLVMLVGLGVKMNRNAQISKDKAHEKFLGYYKLKKLNRKDCANCNLNLIEDYTYDIIKDGKIVGKGEWDLDFGNGFPGYYLVLDDEQHTFILPHDTIWNVDTHE